ncbi:MAG TPA: amidohydrolase [Bryobacteraceae bacterium]|nr:amidohydrolase [Bryobacteraceae bacterium]
MTTNGADVIIHNGKLATQDDKRSFAQAAAIRDGRFVAVGSDREVMAYRDAGTKVIDLHKRTVIPGLNDSHLHLIRGGLNYNLELRWDGVPSLADGLRMLREQAQRTPSGQWVRVVGGWSEFQFAERRLPTIEELNRAAPDTPVFVLHLYDRVLLNRAALRALGYTSQTPAPPGGQIEVDSGGTPTGVLIAKPNAMLLYSALAKGPKLAPEYQMNSSRHFMRELNRLGITSVVDAGGGSQNYPEDYQIINKLHDSGEMSVRIAYNLFTQKPKGELADFEHWTGTIKARQGDDYLRHNGGGEMLVFSAADFEDFLEPRPELTASMEQELKPVVRMLAEHRWPFRLHATYDETISRALDVYEDVNRDVPLKGLHWFIDHAETISQRNMDRIAALGGGIAIQNRMAFQGEYFRDRYGAKTVKRTPPVRDMLSTGLPVGAGTDATRVASYNPFVCLYWLVTGKTMGGLSMYDDNNRLDRMEALRLWTVGSSWFSTEQGSKGAIVPGQLADVAVLSSDYFSVPDEEIKQLESVLTIVGGAPVYGAEEFADLAPPALPVLPDWSPVAVYGGYAKPTSVTAAHRRTITPTHAHAGRCTHSEFGGGFGCLCWAF